MTNIEQLKKETDKIKKGLDELKNNVSLSEVEKKNKAEALKTQAEKAKQKIQSEIDALKDKTDDASKKKKEEAEALLNSFTEITNLYSSILNSAESKPKEETSEEDKQEVEKEEKGFFGKAGDWLGEQWDNVTSGEKRKEEPGKNILRVAGVGLTGYALYKGVKSLWNRAFGGKEDAEDEGEEEDSKEKKKKKKKKSDGETSRWKKFLIGAGIATGTVVGGVEIYKHWNSISSRVKEKLGLALSFDEARQKVENEVRNGKVDADHFGAFNTNFEGGITYNENTQEICSYGQKTKIEKNGKKLQGMNVEFASWEELIHAANIVNFAKRKLRGRGATTTPFIKTDWGGDIAFNCSANGKKEFMSANGSNEWAWILGTLGTAGGGILGSYCGGVKGAAIGSLSGGTAGYALGSYIDNTSTAGRCCETISRGKNLDEFINYLNRQTDENGKSLWESAGEQRIDPNGTPINGVVDNGETDRNKREGVLADIENLYGEDQTGRRNLEILWDEGKPNNYIIKSYGHECKMIIEGLPSKKGEQVDYSKITKIHIEKYNDNDRGDGLDIDFPHTENGLKEAIRVANLTNLIIEDRVGKGSEEYPFNYTKSGGNGIIPSFKMETGRTWKRPSGLTEILSNDACKDKFPTLFKDLKKNSQTGSFWTGIKQEDLHNQALNDESTGSQYIKFLHQMRASNGGQLWKKVG